METLKIAKTDDTPGITLDKALGTFEISGRSLPEDAVDFFEPAFVWLRAYAKAPNPATAFVFKLEYLNTASSKIVQDLLSLLEQIKGVKIVWYYAEDDEDMEDAGHEFSELVEIPFEYKTEY